MSKMLKKYKARIFGDVYTLVSDEEDSLVLDVVFKVDSLMKEYSTKQGAIIDYKKIAVLVALKTTEELLLLQKQVDQDQQQIDTMVQLLSDV